MARKSFQAKKKLVWQNKSFHAKMLSGKIKMQAKKIFDTKKKIEGKKCFFAR